MANDNTSKDPSSDKALNDKASSNKSSTGKSLADQASKDEKGGSQNDLAKDKNGSESETKNSKPDASASGPSSNSKSDASAKSQALAGDKKEPAKTVPSAGAKDTASKQSEFKQSESQQSDTKPADGKGSSSAQTDIQKAKEKASANAAKKLAEAKSRDKPTTTSRTNKPESSSKSSTKGTTAKSETPEAAATAAKAGSARPASSLGLLGLLFLVLGSGVVGGLTVTYLQSQGYFPLASSSLTSGQANGLSPSDAARLRALEADLGSVQQDVAQTLSKYAELETLVDQNAEAASAVAPDPAVDDLQSRVAGLEQAVSDLAMAAPPEASSSIENALPPSGEVTVGDEAAAASIARIGNRVAEVREQLESLSAAVSGLETKLSGRIDTTTEQVDNVTTRVAELEQTAPPANLLSILDGLAPRGDLEEINARLTNIESDESGNNAKKAALALSVADLARAAQDGKPFVAELEAIQVLTEIESPSENLKSFAQSGMNSEEKLVGQFSRLSHDILMADRAAEAKTFVQQLELGFQSMFSVREKGEVEGDTTSAILARAEVRLDEANLEGALTELSGLAGAAAQAAEAWINEARARVELNSVLTALSDKVLSELRKN